MWSLNGERSLSVSHLHHPFLLRSEVSALVDRVYDNQQSSGAHAQDYFRLYLICAIAAVSLQRERAATQPPYNFFMTAQDYLEDVPLLSTLDHWHPHELDNWRLGLCLRWIHYSRSIHKWHPEFAALGTMRHLFPYRQLDMGNFSNLHADRHRTGIASSATEITPARG